MNKPAIMLPVRPKWCAKEYTGEKKGELRKGWFDGCERKKFYIYCSSVKAMNLTDYCEAHIATGGAIDDWSGKVIGEFVCDRIDRFTAEFVDEKKHGVCYEDIRIILPDEYDSCGEPEQRIVTANDDDNPNDCYLCKETCLTFEEIKAYIGENFHDKKFCYIHFSELKFYDTPKELSEFTGRRSTRFGYEPIKITRPPQNWCSVYELNEIPEVCNV